MAEPGFTLTAADERAIAAAVAELDAGLGRPVSELRALLARYRYPSPARSRSSATDRTRSPSRRRR
jgi:hypothetical protein